MRLDGKSIQWAIKQLVEDYKFNPYKILEIVQQWIKSWFKKDYPEFKKSNIIVNIENDGTVSIYRELEVKESDDEEYNEDIHIVIAEAKKIRKDIKDGEKLLINVTPEELELSRIAAQAAWQTIKQGLKNLERERFYDKFQNKQGELLKAQVVRVQWESVILEIEWSPVVLAEQWQIPNRIYEPWEEIFVFLKQISKDNSWITLDITQSTTDYIEAILRKIVPEVDDGLIKIEKIARMAGKKSKIIVSSTDENVDPVWVMVWQQWDRINTVLSLLDWEKLDYIEKVEDPILFIEKCLKPARIENIEIKDKKAIVNVNEDQKPLAIWKWASNVKLASQITWYMIELH